MAFKVINNFISPNDFIPTLLVFRAYPRIVKSNIPNPTVIKLYIINPKIIENI